MRNLIIFGNINSENNLTGPGKVAFNLYKAIKQKESSVSFVNTNTKKKGNCFNLIKCFIRIIFSKDNIINIHSFGYIIPYAVFIISKINKKNSYYLTLHGILSIENEIYGKETSKFKLCLENSLLTKFPNIIVVSNLEKNTLSKKFNRNKDVCVIYNAIESNIISSPKHIREDNKRITLVTAGGISTLKGVFTLLDLVNSFHVEEEIELNLHVYGNIESEKTNRLFNRFIIENHLQNNVFYHGLVSNTQIIKEFRESDLCIALSKYDTFNMTMLESMACGTPVIITESVGISEIINTSHGLILKESANVYEKFKNYINCIMRNPSIYYNLSVNCVNLAKGYTWDIISDKYIQLFNT